MDGLSETRYVSVGDADVAYRVLGDGPTDLLYLGGLGSNIEYLAAVPRQMAFLRRLAAFCRVILLDRRGTGASDRVPGAYPTFEDWTEDLQAVMGAAGSARAAIYAGIDAGPIAILFAAMHPERVTGLVLLNTSARYMRADDHPIGASVEEIDALVEFIGATWGTPDFVRASNPGSSVDDSFVDDTVKLLRFAATPREARIQYDYMLRHADVRQALQLIQAPTRVLHVRDSPMIPLEHGRYLADHIPDARLIELPGASLSTTPNADALVQETAELLTGERPSVDVDRVLTTVLFTDIVSSTEHAASVGDHRWRTLLDEHDRVVREQLRRYRGREINTTGDGFVACFDGPARAVRCGAAIREAVQRFGLELRLGLHTGECVVRGDDLGGLAVHIAARIAALADPGETVVSSTVKDLVVGSSLSFAARGKRRLKGVPGSWRLYAVTHV